MFLRDGRIVDPDAHVVQLPIVEARHKFERFRHNLVLDVRWICLRWCTETAGQPI